MGNIKLTAKYRMSKNCGKILLIFFISITAVVFFGNLPFILESIFSSGIITLSRTSPIYLSVCSALAMLSCFLWILIASPVCMWRESFFYSTAAGRRARNARAFFTGKKLVRACSCKIYFSGLHAFRFCLFELPCAAVGAAIWFCLKRSALTPPVFISMLSCAAALFTVGALFALAANGREQMFWFILFENPDSTAREAAEKSRQLMHGQTLRLLKFKLSFTGWFLLCGLVVPMFYVWGYYKQSVAVLALKNRSLLKI